MNFRQLIEKAMFELRDEFAELVARKLVELMGDEDAAAPKAKAKAKPPSTSSKPTPARSTSSAGKRERAPGTHMTALREKIVAALRGGGPMKKSDVLRAAGLSADEGQRVAQVLRRLKEEGVVRMKGDKATATYTLA